MSVRSMLFLSTIAALLVGVSSSAHADFTGFNNGVNFTLNGGATISGNTLTATDGNLNEARSAFYNTPQSITSFFTQFVYQTSGGGSFPADGVVFVLQNSPSGAAALGNSGGNLGYGGIQPSVGLEFNIFSPNTDGLQLHTNGGLGNYQPTGSVNIGSGDPITVSLLYANQVLLATLTDGGNSYSNSYSIDIPTVVGGNTAFVGFTGGTGSETSLQTVSDVEFTTATPEPGSLALLGSLILCGTALTRRRGRR